MVLKDGGPCIAFKKERGSFVTQICGKTRDHLWYAGPTCKGCYERSNRKRKTEGVATGVAMDLEELQEESQETLVEIEEVYGVRCMPRPCPFPSSTPILSSILSLRLALPAHLTQTHMWP